LEQGINYNIVDRRSLLHYIPVMLFTITIIGHGGSGAAKFADQMMIEILEATPQYKAYVNAKDPSKIELLGEAMRQSFFDADEQLRAFQETGQSDHSGCTSVVACITPNYIICANAGDSRCVMGTGGVTKPLSEDHKPTDEAEKRRIESAGGVVSYKRVDGDLSVSRAFGDFQYKTRPDLPAKQQKVTCDPDITIHERTPSDDVLVLACDGVWDVLSSQDCVELVRDVFAGGESSMLLVAEEIVDTALDKGNIVVHFCMIIAERYLS
jgi:protein phosphatase 2C family protein 2/3